MSLLNDLDDREIAKKSPHWAVRKAVNDWFVEQGLLRPECILLIQYHPDVNLLYKHLRVQPTHCGFDDIRDVLEADYPSDVQEMFEALRSSDENLYVEDILQEILTRLHLDSSNHRLSLAVTLLHEFDRHPANIHLLTQAKSPLSLALILEASASIRWNHPHTVLFREENLARIFLSATPLNTFLGYAYNHSQQVNAIEVVRNLIFTLRNRLLPDVNDVLQQVYQFLDQENHRAFCQAVENAFNDQAAYAIQAGSMDALNVSAELRVLSAAPNTSLAQGMGSTQSLAVNTTSSTVTNFFDNAVEPTP